MHLVATFAKSKKQRIQSVYGEFEDLKLSCIPAIKMIITSIYCHECIIIWLLLSFITATKSKETRSIQ